MKVEPDFTEESKALGYYPFVRISPLEWLTFKGLHGAEWVLNLFSRLKDPMRLHTEWAVSFASAAAELPSEKLDAAEDVYRLVTKSRRFRFRTIHMNKFNKFFFDEVWFRIKSGDLDGFDESVRSMLLADFERWRVVLKVRNEALREQQKKLAEKAERRLAHEAATKAAQERRAAEAKAADEKTATAARDLEAKAAAEKETATEKQKPQTLPKSPAPARKEPVIERRPAGASARPPSGNVWRNPNPGQPVVVRKNSRD